jgi:hypothetical protein
MSDPLLEYDVVALPCDDHRVMYAAVHRVCLCWARVLFCKSDLSCGQPKHPSRRMQTAVWSWRCWRLMVEASTRGWKHLARRF